MKNKDEFQKYKLFTDTNNKYSYKQRANIMQVIKKNELKALNFDPMKYKRKLLNIQNPKKELAQNKEIQKITYTKKDPFRFFGPYNRSIICGGGFCKRLYKKNYNLNVIYDTLLQKMPKYNKKTEQINLSSNENKDKFNHKTKKNRNEENILIEENNIFNTFTNNNKNSKDKIRYNLKSNNKNNSIENRHQKINITEVNKSIKYLKLAKNLNDKSKEKSFKNKIDKKNQNHLIDISNKKNQTRKNYQKLVFNGINHINNINKISIKKHPKLIPNLEINQTPLFTPRIEEYSKRILVKDTIEQFSMENTEIKKFNNLSEIDNILLKFSPINKSFDCKNLSHNYIISSDRIEYNIIKKIPKIEPKKKLIIKTNELVILSNSKPKINNNKDIINKSKEKEKEKEIIIINNEENKEEKKEEKITIESEKKEESITKNNQKETKEDKNTNNNIKVNISENNEEEIIENRKPSRTVIDRLAKHRERLKKRNEANNKKEVNKPNKIKNIAFELESKMFKKEVEKEEENKIKTEIEKDKENYCKPISETNYNIPVIHKKKMKKKVFDGL